MQKQNILKMCKAISKELGILNIRLKPKKAAQLDIVIKDQLQNWLSMSEEKAYEDIYRTFICMLELWKDRKI
jgi:hypothetical protein